MEQVPAIEIQGLATSYNDDGFIHEDLDLTINQGEIVALVGGSGCGKTTLLRAILQLLRPQAGTIKVFGEALDYDHLESELSTLRRWGVLFQQGALFSAFTVLQNVCFPLKELTDLPDKLIEEIAILKINMAEFPMDSIHKYPSELSGGMLKRAALARAICMDPDILFLDEPTAGLDPNAASRLDALVKDLQQSLQLTIVLVTHDLDTLWSVTDRVAFLGEKRVLAMEGIRQLIHNDNPLIVEYFNNPRAKLMSKSNGIESHQSRGD